MAMALVLPMPDAAVRAGIPLARRGLRGHASHGCHQPALRQRDRAERGDRQSRVAAGVGDEAEWRTPQYTTLFEDVPVARAKRSCARDELQSKGR